MNKYKFLGMLFHFIYRALSGITKKEYYYEIENFDRNSQNIVVEKYLRYVMLQEL